MTESEKNSNFWTTLPGILTGVAALITAIVGAYVGIASINNSSKSSSPPSPPALASPDEQKYDVTGVWKRDDSGDATWYIRQVDSKIWWYGEGPGWSVVSHGTWDGKKFRTDWADVPYPGKNNKESGQSTIVIIDFNKLRVMPDGRKEYYLIRE